MGVFSGDYGTGTQVTYDSLPDWVKEGAFQNYQDANTITSGPAPVYGGPRVAGETSDQTAAYDLVRQNVGAAQPGYDAAMERATYGAGNLTDADIQRFLNPFTQNVVNTTVDQIRKNEAIQRKNLGMQTQAYGGDRHGVAEGVLMGNTNDTVARAIAELMYGGYNQALSAAQADRARAQSGAPIMVDITGRQSQDRLRDAAALETVGTKRQGQIQQNLDTAYEDWLRQVDWPFQMLNYRMGALTGQPHENTRTTQTPIPMADPFQQSIGTLATLYGLFND